MANNFRIITVISRGEFSFVLFLRLEDLLFANLFKLSSYLNDFNSVVSFNFILGNKEVEIVISKFAF